METVRIHSDPDVMLGKPVIRGTRIPVDLLLRKLGEGAADEDLLDAYPRLTREDLQGGSLEIKTLRVGCRRRTGASFSSSRARRFGLGEVGARSGRPWGDHGVAAAVVWGFSYSGA